MAVEQSSPRAVEAAPRRDRHVEDIERDLRLARELTRAIEEAETVEDAFERALRQLCEETGGVVGQVWVPTPGGDGLRCASPWYARAGAWEPFRRASRSFVFPRGVGPPGRAWAAGGPVWVSYTDGAENVPRAPWARQVGIVTGMSVPVVADQEVVAVIEVFWDEHREEDARLLDLVATVVGQLGSLILRRRAEEATRKSDELFRAVAESTPDAIVSADEQGLITYFNPAAERIFGHRATDVAGQPLTVLMPERFRAPHRAGIARFLETGQARVVGRTVEVAGLHKDGSEFPCDMSLATASTGGSTFFIATIRDVTERRRAEVHVAEAQRLASLGSWELDLATQETAWSPQLSRLLGLDPETCVPSMDVIMERVHPEDRPVLERATERAFAGEHTPLLRFRVVRPDGEIRFVEARSEAVVDSVGRPVRIRGTAQDVTERHHVESALREEEEKFRALLEFAPEATLGVTADGRVALANARVEAVFGYRRDEVVGQPVEVLLADDVKGIVAQRFREAHANGRAGSARADSWPADLFELCGRRKDGSEFPMELSVSRLETAEGTLVLSTVHDITDRLRAEEEREALRARLHQTERLESVGLLAGGIAHDFNNLLAVILNYAAFVRDQIGEEHPAHHDVEEIRRAAERAADLTRQLLMFSRRDVVKPRVLDVGRVLAGMEQLLRRTIGEHVELRTEVADGLPSVCADPGQVEQVVVNLAVNARDAMPDGGTLTIEAAEARLDAQPGADVEPGAYVRLSVTDTGSGMDESVRARVFEPFFTTKPKGRGTGLGLATVYGVVKQAGGHVEIDSRPGAGTAVHAYLPRAGGPAPVEAAGGPGGVTAPGRGEVVLVVEDDDVVRALTTRILSEHGYRVLAAPGAAEALAACERLDEPIDLLLTDVVMPQTSGAALAAELSARAPGPAPRVLYMSGYPDDFVGGRDGVPATALLEKPFDGESLLARVQDALAPEPAAAS